MNYKAICDILKGKARITVPTALRLGKYFGNSHHYWLDLQISSEINKLSADKKFQTIIKNIPKAEKQKYRAQKNFSVNVNIRNNF